ncbi:MAG: hypothetical protein JWM80_776 [Cyanobacteria bacterium RYN_339]|nr:hypothetical protein [Cyanobacteria bacterium RYN_339]
MRAVFGDASPTRATFGPPAITKLAPTLPMNYVRWMTPYQLDRVEALLRAYRPATGVDALPMPQLVEGYLALHAWDAQLDAIRWTRRDVRYETEHIRKVRERVACAVQANVNALLRLEMALVERGQPGLDTLQALFLGDDMRVTLRLVRHAGRYFSETARPVFLALLDDQAAEPYHDHIRHELKRKRPFAPMLGSPENPGLAPMLAPREAMEYGFGHATPRPAPGPSRESGARRRSGRA